MTTPLPTWSLCIATMNRPDILRRTVEYALAQTVPPVRIAVVDASDDCTASGAAIEALGAAAAVSVVYEPSARRSTAWQRNRAVELGTGDIAFLIDDDSFMYPDCAERILEVYAADTGRRIAAVGSARAHEPHDAIDLPQSRNEQSLGLQNLGRIKDLTRRSALARFMIDKVLMLGLDQRQVHYDFALPHHGADAFAALAIPGVVHVPLINGFQLTVRRDVALREPIEGTLLGYSPGEDGDVTYRYARHGLTVLAPAARIYHFESAASREKVQKVRRLQLSNVIYFARRHGRGRLRVALAGTGFLLRTLLATFLRDVLSRRLSLPSLRTALAALPDGLAILARSETDLVRWYQTRQAAILGRPLSAFTDWRPQSSPASIRTHGPNPSEALP